MNVLQHLSPLAAIGGCEVNCLRVIEGLPEHRHRVLVLDEPGPMCQRWNEAGAEVECLRAWRGGAGPFVTALTAWRARHDAPGGICCWSASRLPQLLSALAPWRLPMAVHLGNPPQAGLAHQLRRWCWERLHRPPPGVTLAACSRQVAAGHRRARYFRNFPIEVIYNAVAPTDEPARKHRNLGAEQTARIGMVARLERIKDHVTILRALAAPALAGLPLVVEFAGDGELRSALERAAARLGVSPRVRFLGFQEVRPLLASWDLYVHSTTVQEGMGTAVAEAMTAELPCLVSDLPVMREVCGSEAAYFAAGDSEHLARRIATLIRDRTERERLGSAGRARAARLFAREQMAAAYWSLIAPSSAAAIGSPGDSS